MVDNKPPEQNSREEVQGRFDSYTPKEAALIDIAYLRTEFKELADTIWHAVPAGREKSTALTKLEEAMNWVNKGISRHNQDPAAGPAK